MIWFIITYIVWILFWDKWFVTIGMNNFARFISSSIRFPAGIFIIYCIYRGFTQMNWITI